MTQSDSKSKETEKKLDAIIRLLENLYILDAARAGIGRDHIRAVLGVHTTRISSVMKGLK